MGAMVVLLLLFLTIDPLEMGWHCRFHKWSGMSCPTCGLSRSLHETMHLNIAAAIRLHPFGPLIVGLMLAVLGRLGYVAFYGGPFISERYRVPVRWFVGIVAVAWIVFWLVRLALELAGKW